jgi:hypothetical protein
MWYDNMSCSNMTAAISRLGVIHGARVEDDGGDSCEVNLSPCVAQSLDATRNYPAFNIFPYRVGTE